MIKSYGSAARFNVRFGNPHSKLQDTMTKRAEKNIKENCFKSVKALKVIAILTAYL
jgi:hypothetical protein